MARTSCPNCCVDLSDADDDFEGGHTDFSVHCSSELCAWLVCNVCKTVWDYASDRQFTPPPKSSTR